MRTARPSQIGAHISAVIDPDVKATLQDEAAAESRTLSNLVALILAAHVHRT